MHNTTQNRSIFDTLVTVLFGFKLYLRILLNKIQYLRVLSAAGTLRWRCNGRDSVSNHQPHDCLLNRLFRRRSKKTSKLCVTGLCVGNSPGTGEFPAHMASNAENVSIWWRHHDILSTRYLYHYMAGNVMAQMVYELIVRFLWHWMFLWHGKSDDHPIHVD